METNIYSCTRAGRTISEKTMEDGNIVNTKDDKITTTSLTNIYSERPQRLTANGHDFAGESSSPPDESCNQRRLPADTSTDEKFKQRINPLRIHLGKRPFVDNSLQYYNPAKKRKLSINKSCDSSTSINTVPRVPKLIPKHIDRSQFHNASSTDKCVNSEKNKPVPRLVPKSQMLQFKKGKTEKGSQLKEYAQSLGLQPMVKFKCRKCCSMSFKTLAMLKEHQLVCRAQVKEPALSPEAAPCTNEINNGGPSRVTRKVYLCSACGTYYENWNLFLHMREVHNRHICLFCLGMFSKAEKLSAHLTNKHNVKEFNYDSKEDFFNVYSGTLYLMCCACDEICSEKDDFFNHDCNNVKPKPVPVLISKNAVKANSIKNAKTSNEITTNGPSSIVKETTKYVCDKKDIENKMETVTSSTHRTMAPKPETTCSELAVSDTSTTSDISATVSKDTTVDSGTDSPDMKQIPSPINQNIYSPESTKHIISNGADDSIDHSDESDSPVPDEVQEPIEEAVKNCDETICPPVEKECGIKLKLSLNNANSPVIINSTVDPTIGQQKAHKPPSRTRRPPKRYEKEKKCEPVVPPKPPSIKMTICDRADSPFVKTTIFENNKETTLKTLLNNNLDSVTKVPECKPENTVKTTIYDNKLDDTNTLNRVPKLTVKLPKELLDKDSSSEYSSDSDVSDKLTVDEFNTTQEENTTNTIATDEQENKHMDMDPVLSSPTECKDLPPETENSIQVDDDNKIIKTELKTEPEEQTPAEPIVEEPTIPVTELSLDKPLDRYPLKDLLKVFLASTVHNCIYCNHVRKIAVNCEQLALHMMTQHRFRATVDSITAEELMPETITARLRTGAEELRSVYINLDSYDSVDKCDDVQYDYIFECFQCYFKTAIHKDLYLHNRKMHQKAILLCVMCKCNFFSYSELICHLCPGTYETEYEIKFRCCLCSVDTIPSQFRLMVHFRKMHHTCDVCLELCHNQARLSNHVWKHKLHHLCYRCGIAYRNKPDITNHLFWKHGTESVLCKKCLHKKWPHVYHFCTPPAIFLCEECSLQFTRAVYLKVHKRFHSGEYPHVCTELDCTEKFVSKKLLNKHLEEHKKKLLLEDFIGDKPLSTFNEVIPEASKEPIPVIDLVNNTIKEEAGSSDVKAEPGTEKLTKKDKKKKLKDKDALLLDVNLPALNLSESDSSDESDSGNPPVMKSEKLEEVTKDETVKSNNNTDNSSDINNTELEAAPKDEKIEPLDEKPSDQQVLDIWDNFKKYQAKVEKQKEKTPPLVPIRKHVCESDHDYCLIPTDMNGDDDIFNSDKKKNKKTPKKQRGDLSSSSSSSSDSDSSCSCGSNCSCSSSSGSSSSSSSDSDSSDESGNEKKKSKRIKKTLPNRKLSTGSNVDVMGMSETPILIPEKTEPPIAETDLETDESETDEEFYDENPQQLANKLNEEKRNQLITVPSAGPSDAGSISGEASQPPTPIPTTPTRTSPIPMHPISTTPTPMTPVKDEKYFKEIKEEPTADDMKVKTSSKKKSKKKKRSKNSKKHGPIKINIPKDVLTKSEVEAPPLLVPNKITISLQSNTVQIPVAPKVTPTVNETNKSTPQTSIERKRASKRRRVPNKFYGYSSDEEAPQTPLTALKPQQPPKLEWRKEDLPSPVSHKPKKEVPSTVLSNRLYNYTDTIRLTTPIPDPEPPRILMNSESMESSDSDSSDEGNLEIYQPNSQSSVPPPPTYLNSGTSSLPYAFQRPAVREAREGESVYCYCRCPYDEVSEMIACDAEGCPIEWFHFECVGIMVPPKGKWYCPECRKNQSFSGYR